MSAASVILCPGQGAQRPGMGKAWFDASAEAAQTFGAADQILGDRFEGKPLSELCFRGAAETLNRTDVAQPAIFVVSVACHQALQCEERDEEMKLSAAAGLSLGEYTALHLAGAICFQDALELVALRGAAMQEASQQERGAMVALIGADEEKASEICDAAAGGSVLVTANFNAPGQIVLSGHADACDRAMEAAPTMGLRAARLPVAGAFHSPLMESAAEKLAAALDRVEIRPPAVPVVSNVTARAHEADDEGDIINSIRRRLVEQLTSPVRWTQSCRWLLDNVEGSLHELAPGRTLAGLMKRTQRSAKVTSHDQPETSTDRPAPVSHENARRIVAPDRSGGGDGAHASGVR